MSESIVIIGKESYICFKLCERLALEGRDVITLGYEASKYARTVPWNRCSYISTKTACRELLRANGIPSEIFIVFGSQYEEIFPTLTTHKVDEIIDGEMKALVHLTQELYKKILDQGANSSIYFVTTNLPEQRHQLSHAINLGLRAYCQALMHSELPIYMLGFELVNTDEDGFVDYVLKVTADHVEKKRNSWMIYPKPGLFVHRH